MVAESILCIRSLWGSLLNAELLRIIKTLNTKFLVRAVIVILALTAIALTIISLLLPYLLPRGPSFGPTPLPPTILAPRGELPSGLVGLEEWSQAHGQAYELIGSGFLLRLSESEVVGVTTAHSVWMLGTPNNSLERIAFHIAGQDTYVAEFDTLYGQPGVAFKNLNLAMDYVLLKLDQPIDESLALTPDPRGAPQPGERVALFSGLGDGQGGRRELAGTVQSVDAQGIWVVMDEVFDPGRMSGSPLISQHTGQVIGMAIAATYQGDRLYIGFHPIGNIIRIAAAANQFPKIAEYRR